MRFNLFVTYSSQSRNSKSYIIGYDRHIPNTKGHDYMNKKIAITLALFCTIGAFAFDKSQTNAEIETQQATISVQAETLTAKKQEIETKQEELDTLNIEASELRDKRLELEDKVNTLTTTLEERDTTVTELQQRIEGLEADLKAKHEREAAEQAAIEASTQTYAQETVVPVSTTATQSNATSFTVEASAYTALDGAQSGITATGVDVRGTSTYNGMGIIAVDPNVIPLWSVVSIEGYGTFIALDTGGLIKGNRIDVLFGSVSDALNFGRRSVTVTILN